MINKPSVPLFITDPPISSTDSRAASASITRQFPRTQRYMIAAYLASVVLFDFVTKSFHIPIGMNDLLMIGMLCLIPLVPCHRGIGTQREHTQARWGILLGLLSYWIVCFAADTLDGDCDYMRPAQFIYRALIFFVSTFYFMNNPSAACWFFKCWRRLLVIVCGIAALQLIVGVAGGKLIPYSSGRVMRGIEQTTSVFSEPALLSQFLVASLFILFRSIDSINRGKLLLLATVGAIILSQSMGGLIGLCAWAAYMVLKRSEVSNSLRWKLYTLSLISISITTLMIVAPYNRISVFFGSQEFQNETSSSSRRVSVEMITLSDFLHHESPLSVAFGLSSNDARYYRSDRLLVPFNDDISGNGVVEYVLRYGVTGLLLLLLCFYILVNYSILNFGIMFVFFLLVAQIDGSIAKPYIFVYTTALITSLVYHDCTTHYAFKGTRLACKQKWRDSKAKVYL